MQVDMECLDISEFTLLRSFRHRLLSQQRNSNSADGKDHEMSFDDYFLERTRRELALPLYQDTHVMFREWLLLFNDASNQHIRTLNLTSCSHWVDLGTYHYTSTDSDSDCFSSDSQDDGSVHSNDSDTEDEEDSVSMSHVYERDSSSDSESSETRYLLKYSLQQARNQRQFERSRVAVKETIGVFVSVQCTCHIQYLTLSAWSNQRVREPTISCADLQSIAHHCLELKGLNLCYCNLSLQHLHSLVTLQHLQYLTLEYIRCADSDGAGANCCRRIAFDPAWPLLSLDLSTQTVNNSANMELLLLQLFASGTSHINRHIRVLNLSHTNILWTESIVKALGNCACLQSLSCDCLPVEQELCQQLIQQGTSGRLICFKVQVLSESLENTILFFKACVNLAALDLDLTAYRYEELSDSFLHRLIWKHCIQIEELKMKWKNESWYYESASDATDSETEESTARSKVESKYCSLAKLITSLPRLKAFACNQYTRKGYTLPNYQYLDHFCHLKQYRDSPQSHCKYAQTLSSSEQKLCKTIHLPLVADEFQRPDIVSQLNSFTETQLITSILAVLQQIHLDAQLSSVPTACYKHGCNRSHSGSYRFIISN